MEKRFNCQKAGGFYLEKEPEQSEVEIYNATNIYMSSKMFIYVNPSDDT